ncbi:alpha/beta fold hydrolase [Flavobacterium sp. 3HN19-14]|uniref:alpha/beta fold hydrolase n=1 Tax=Flavobacterium sp. 3HN19-14 TaxID=3448133 RepID=UPI003EE23635
MLYSKIEGTGKPLLILHGYLGMSDNWKTLSGQYAEQGFEVHALDLRNHGRSLHSDIFTYEVMVEDLIQYCESHKLEAIDIIGHSMGGKVAMFFATSHPEKVEKLIVADIAPRYYHPHHQDIMAALNAVDFSQKPSRAAVETLMSEHIQDFGTRQFLMKSLYWKEPGQLDFRFNLKVFNEQIDNIGKALPENAIFEKPTLFLKGEKSNYISEKDEADIKHHFPDSKIEIIANAGHWLHAENPTAFFDKTIAFLK